MVQIGIDLLILVGTGLVGNDLSNSCALESMSPWMAELFSSGQPVFEDEVFEPVFIDDEGSLSAHCELVPAPRLELGTPWCLLRRLDTSNYSQVLYQLS